MPVTYAVIRTSVDFVSCGLLQSVACAWSIAAAMLVIPFADAVISTNLLKVSSYVHRLSKHGCKIFVAFLEVH
jgi:hypothetical protein